MAGQGPDVSRDVGRLVALLLVLVVGSTALSQVLPFRNYGVDDGFPGYEVRVLVQDREGYLWLAVDRSLCRFDGTSCEVMFPEPGRQGFGILDALQDRDGTLWFAGYGGLLSYDGHSFRYYDESHGLGDTETRTLLQDGDGNLWVGTKGGLSRRTDDGFANIAVTDRPSASFVLDLQEDQQGVLWAASYGGVSRLVDGALTDRGVPDDLAHEATFCILARDDGTLWFGRPDGLLKLDQGTVTHYSLQDGVANEQTLALCQARDGTLWLGTQTGLSAFDGQAFANYDIGNGLVAVPVISILQDWEQNLWAGTGYGLSRLSTRAFVTFTHEWGLPSDVVVSVLIDRADNVWAGTSGYGLCRLAGSDATVFTADDGLAGNVIQTLYEDRQGRIWIGTGGDGVSRLHQGRFQTFTPSDGLLSGLVNAIIEDAWGDIWLGTAKGLNRLSDNEMTSITPEHGLASTFVRCLYEDRQKNLWVGTRVGISKLRQGQFLSFSASDELRHDRFNDIAEDDEGNLWLATEAGLCKFDGTTIARFTTDHGFVSARCQAILNEDGKLYITTPKGLHQFDPTSGRARVLTTGRGLAGASLMPQAAASDRRGNLWFGSSRGLVRFRPDLVRFNDSPPHIQIRRVTAQGSTLPAEGGVRLPHTVSDLHFHYVGLSFTAPEQVLYRHRLVGLKHNWVETSETSVVYPPLAPGSYTFQVEARNSDGLWSTRPATFSFAIAPPYWATWWFRGAAVLGFLALLALGHHLRTRFLTRRNEELQREIAERRRAEQSLAEAQHMAHLGNWDWDVRTGQVKWSREVYHIFGLDPNEFQPQIDSIMSRFHPDDRHAHEKLIEQALADQRQCQFEARIELPDGDARHVFSTSQGHYDDQGNLIRLTGTVQDITERKRAEDELRKNEAAARALINAPVDTVLLLDTNGIVQDCNEAVIRDFSASRDEVVGSCIWDKFAPDVTARRKAYADKVVRKGESVRFEDERNGIWYDNTLYPVFDDRQKVTGVAVIARDITEWRRAQQALRDSEQRFRAIFEQAAVGAALIATATGRFLRVNRKYGDIVGLTPEEMTATTFMAITHPDDLQEQLDHTERLKAGSIREFSIEKRYFRKDGSVVWVNLTVSPMWTPGEQPTCHIAVVEDITIRKHAEQALRESESKLREAQQMAHLGHWFWDVKTGDVEWSREVYNIFQLKPQEFTPQIDSILALSPWPEDHQRDKELIRRAIESHESGSYEQRFLRPDGSTGYYYSTFQGIYDDRGNLAAMKGTVQDITERKQAEEVQEQRVRELAAINEVGRIVTASLSLDQVAQAAVDGIVATLAPDLAVVLFRDGDELRLLACGPDRSGFSREDIPPHVLGECLCGLALTESRPLYSYNIHNDPRCTWDECKRAGMRSFAALPLYGLERTIGVLGLASATECDYSKRATFLEALAAQVAAGLQNASLHGQVKNHAAELEQRVVERTAELQEANKELETFAYTVSHDLKAPLRGIDGYSRLLTQDYADVLDEEGKIFLHNIRNATSHMNQLIDDLLAYARLERRTLETSRLDPRSLVEALLAERAADLHGSSTTVSVDIPAITISADAEGLTQALRNLIDNAIKFTAGVPQPAIRVGACETDHGCVLWVRDNGIGFDMRYKDRIFEIFHRLHRAEDFPGTGIGLAIVRKAIESMNGCIWAESAPGKGAAFSLYLPK